MEVNMKLSKEFNKLYTKISKKALKLAKLPKNLKQFVTFDYAYTIQKAPIRLYYCGYFVGTIPLVSDDSDIYHSDFYTIHHIAAMIKEQITVFAGKRGLELLNSKLKSEATVDE
jgi:hypothetical protein